MKKRERNKHRISQHGRLLQKEEQSPPISAHFSAQYVASVGTARELAGTIPLDHLCQCAVTPPWTAYGPPRGAAAACSGSSSAAGCSHCCLPEGQMRQPMRTKKGKAAITLQIKAACKHLKSTDREHEINNVAVTSRDSMTRADTSVHISPCSYFLKLTLRHILCQLSSPNSMFT